MKAPEKIVCRSTLLAACLLVLGSPVTSWSQGSAGQAGEFLRWGTGAKAMGLGRAFTSIADDASAMYWNPAGMAALDQVGGTFMFMHMPMQEGSSVNYLAGAIPLRLLFAQNHDPGSFVRGLQELKLGVGVLWHSLGDFQLFDRNAAPVAGNAGASADQSAVYISASYPLNLFFRGFGRRSALARAFAGKLDIGFTTKLVHQDLFGTGVSATSFDLGFKYAHHSGIFNVGLALRDFNSPRFSRGNGAFPDEIPANGVIGVSLQPPLWQLNGLTLSFDYGFLTPAQRDHDTMFGLEYNLASLNSEWPVKLRLGSNSNHESLTFGISFSPEELLGHDWVPSADWTYGNDRSRFDAVGARYSFSVDRNPFTARYWYLAAEAELSQFNCHHLTAGDVSERALTYLRNAESAKNTGKRAFRYEAALRRADLEFFSALQSKDGFESKGPDPRLIKAMKRVGRYYTSQSRRAMQMDSGRAELDSEAYLRSFLNYVQAMILAGENEAALTAIRAQGRSWGRHLDLSQQLSQNPAFFAAAHYVEAYALYSQDLKAEAVQLLTKSIPEMPQARFLLGHIYFLEGNYQDVLNVLDGFDLNAGHLTDGLFLPFTGDCTFGDEVLFLRAVSLYKLSDPEHLMNALTEFAKIPRFFPKSDLGKFLTNHNELLANLTDAYEAGNFESLNERIEKMIQAYVKTFSNGTLLERHYSFNLN